MQSVSSKIWTQVAVSFSYNDNNYTGTSEYHRVPVTNGNERVTPHSLKLQSWNLTTSLVPYPEYPFWTMIDVLILSWGFSGRKQSSTESVGILYQYHLIYVWTSMISFYKLCTKTRTC